MSWGVCFTHFPATSDITYTALGVDLEKNLFQSWFELKSWHNVPATFIKQLQKPQNYNSALWKMKYKRRNFKIVSDLENSFWFFPKFSIAKEALKEAFLNFHFKI